VEDEDEWANLTTGAWCYYENKISNGTTYGKLYNWFAVNDPRGLAPKGYHIPTDAECTILTDNLGDKAGTKMKNTFAMLPGGYRVYDGRFGFIGSFGYWWSSSEFNANYAWNRNLGYSNGSVNRHHLEKLSGFSVRCLRD